MRPAPGSGRARRRRRTCRGRAPAAGFTHHAVAVAVTHERIRGMVARHRCDPVCSSLRATDAAVPVVVPHGDRLGNADRGAGRNRNRRWLLDRERSTAACQADVCEACGMLRMTWRAIPSPWPCSSRSRSRGERADQARRAIQGLGLRVCPRTPGDLRVDARGTPGDLPRDARWTPRGLKRQTPCGRPATCRWTPAGRPGTCEWTPGGRPGTRPGTPVGRPAAGSDGRPADARRPAGGRPRDARWCSSVNDAWAGTRRPGRGSRSRPSRWSRLVSRSSSRT